MGFDKLLLLDQLGVGQVVDPNIAEPVPTCKLDTIG